VSEVVGRVPTQVGFLPAAKPSGTPAVGVVDPAPSEGAPPSPDYSERVILLGRLKAGTTRETRRVVHVFLLASKAQSRAELTPVCGESLAAVDMQWLPGMTGMPCEPCLLRSDDTGSATHPSSFGYGVPPAKRDPAAVSVQQRRLLGGTATPSPGPELSW
jgi:hypothetical protein